MKGILRIRVGGAFQKAWFATFFHLVLYSQLEGPIPFYILEEGLDLYIAIVHAEKKSDEFILDIV